MTNSLKSVQILMLHTELDCTSAIMSSSAFSSIMEKHPFKSPRINDLLQFPGLETLEMMWEPGRARIGLN